MIDPTPPDPPPDPATLASHTLHYLPQVAPNGLVVSDLVLPLCVDRYILVSELARGGMGVIYRARDLAFNRDLAVKVLLPAHAHKPALIHRAWTEARVTALLEHSGIVPVHAAGHLPDGRPYFSMTLVDGQTLADLIRLRTDPTDGLPRLLKLFEQVCQTIAYAHSRGVVHRDIKPANVLVALFGVALVIDWGVAKVLPNSPLGLADLAPPPPADAPPPAAAPPAKKPGTTLYGVVLGTAEYMAPEQVGGDATLVDTRTDVFALGGMLCHILTGHPPYEGETVLQVLEKAAAAEVYVAHARLDMCGADPRLVKLAKTCLSADPNARPFDAQVVANTLAGYLESNMQLAEQDLTRFFELSLDMFCIAGLDGFFKRVNGNFSRVLGHSTAELLRQPFLHFVHPDDWPATQAVMGELTRGRPVVRFKNRYRHANGDLRTLEWTAKSIPEEGVVFAIARDVTTSMTE